MPTIDSTFHQEIRMPTSFKEFLLKDRRNRITLWISFISIVLLLSIFKYFYPYASYIHGDSFVYLDTAYNNLGINSYMIGYSMFLRAFSVFSSSDTLLVSFQYLLLQVSAMSLSFTLFYFYRPSKVAQGILVAFIVLNPLFLYISNLVSSDSFFASLSLIWFTLLLWILNKPNPKLTIWHAIVIFIAFTVRYNALIYLFIASITFLLSKQPIQNKILGITSGALLISLFIVHTGNQFKKLTGTWQYSPFAGWLWANNAMYTYRYVDSADRKPVPEKFRSLDNIIRSYFDHTRDTSKFPIEKEMASTFYMWSPGLPLFQYRDSIFKNDSTSSDLKKWAYMGPIYKDYGLFIIKEYPLHFVRYFLWPTTIKYYAPPVEFLGTYNSGKDSVNPIAATWFHYKSLRVTTRTKDPKVEILDFYTILSGIINMVMLFGVFSFSILGGWRQNLSFKKGLILGMSFWLLNALFTIFASPAALRFQCFPIILTSIFTALLVDFIWKTSNEISAETGKEQLVLNKVFK